MYVFFLAADSRAEEKVRAGQNSTFAKIGNVLLKQAIARNSSLRDAQEKLQAEIEKVSTKAEDGRWSLTEINDVETLISSELSRFDPSVQIVTSTDAPRLVPLTFSMKLDVRDEFVQGVGKMGRGLRRSLLFSMLRALRELRSSQSHAAETEGGADTIPSLCIFLIEEPEL